MSEDYEFSADNKSEALRLMLFALERRKDEMKARKLRGRRVLVEQIRVGTPLAPSPNRLTREDFEQIAIYLSVSFSEEESGAIVAEVGEEPTGEVLNAIFQNADKVVFRVTWS